MPPPPPVAANSSISTKPSIITATSSMALPPPPPPPALFLPSKPSPQPHHHHHLTRSPSPPSTSISKFAQVRDIFARAEAAAAAVAHVHHPRVHIQMKNSIQNSQSISHQTPSIDRSRSPKSVTVLDVVQEYQRQINHHQSGYKRFAHFGWRNT